MWIQRDLATHITTMAQSFPALVLTGARQAGKTSLLCRLFPDHTYVSLDIPSTAELASTSPQEFLARYPPPLLVDEVQYAPSTLPTPQGRH
jgi:predicted AAA+ superfamily ATPase